MKRKLLAATVLTVALMGGGTGAVQAGFGPGGGFGPPPGAGPGPGDFVFRMAKVLKLTDAQQGQIQAILDAEAEQVKPMLDKLHENRRLLMLAGEATAFDESAVRNIATAQAQVEIELTVARICTQSRINGVLTAEQLELLQHLRPDPGRRPQPPAGDGE